MTQREAIDYCYKHKNQYVSSLCEMGEDGEDTFNCLIGCLESGCIFPSELADYGMDYK